MADLKLVEIYADDIIQIHFDRAHSVIQLTFQKTPNLEQFRNGYSLAIDTASYKDARYWLTDASQIKVMQPENQDWLKQKMASLIKSAQIRKFAIVMAPECFVMTNPNRVYQKAAPTTDAAPASPIKVHFDKDAAFAWLFSDN